MSETSKDFPPLFTDILVEAARDKYGSEMSRLKAETGHQDEEIQSLQSKLSEAKELLTTIRANMYEASRKLPEPMCSAFGDLIDAIDATLDRTKPTPAGSESFHESIIRSAEKLAHEIHNDVMAEEAEIAAAIQLALDDAYRRGQAAQPETEKA